MDLQTLSNLFAATLSSDPNARRSAELQIRKVANETGMLAALLQIIGADSIDIATRQACSVWLKNRVQSNYTLDAASRRPDQALVATSDRDALRASLLPLLAASPSRSITVQLASALKTVVAHDFPDRWPGLVDSIKGMLSSGEIGQVHAGCVAALESVRAFRFRQKADILPSLVAALFPTLVDIAAQMMQNPFASAGDPNHPIPALLHLILKTYKTSIVVHLSPHQQSAESLVPWGRLLFGVVSAQIPPEAVPADEDDRERSEWWRAKKWAYGVLGRLFHRFGNPSQLPTALQPAYAGFAAHFVSVFAPEILAIYLRQVELCVKGEVWMSKKCQYQVFVFFTECIKPKSTWTLLKPHAQTLVETFVFPQLSFNAARQQLWESDPVDYVRVSVDEYESFATPVSAATTFLFSLASNRTKTTFMPILTFINSILRSNAPPAQRFGALNMTAALGPWILRHPDVANGMEQFVLQFVGPEFGSPEGYMRAIACEVLGTVTKEGLKFSSDEHLSANYRAVMGALDDPELPVRVQAALTLTEMVMLHDSVKTAVSPQVGKVIQDLLKLSDETDLDILNHSMEVMVEAFQTELLPVAAQLTARLCDSYLRLIKESLVAEEAYTDVDASIEQIMVNTDEDKTYAAMGVAKTIGTIISSIEGAPEILAQVQEVIIPVITFTFKHKILDLFDNMYELVDSLTFKLRSISPNLWPVFELTYNLFKSDAVDFLEEMLPSLDNFVSYGSDVIKTRPEYQRMLLDIYTTSITSDQLGENDRVNGCKLAESILLNLRGSVDDALQPIIVTALGQLDKSETASLRLANLEVLINAVLYNPAAALHIIEATQAGMARKFFDTWFVAIGDHAKMPRVHDKKLSIMALCALLEMPAGAVPETLKEGWPGIVGGVLTIFKDLPGAIQARKALEEMEDDDDGDDLIEEKILNMNEDDEDVWDEDSAYMEMLANEGARLRQKSEKAEEGESDDDDEDDVIDEELGYFSALDTVDPYATFKQALTTFQMQNGPVYQAATTSLSLEQQTLLMEVMRIAETQTGGVAVSA